MPKTWTERLPNLIAAAGRDLINNSAKYASQAPHMTSFTLKIKLDPDTDEAQIPLLTIETECILHETFLEKYPLFNTQKVTMPDPPEV